MMSSQRGAKPGSLLAAAGALLGTVLAVVYVAIVTKEGDTPTVQIATWAAIMAAPAILAWGSMPLPPRAARWALLGATVLFAPLVMLTSFSPGYLIAGILTGIAAYQANEAFTHTSR